MRRQLGIVDFVPLKPLFLAVASSSHAVSPGVPSAPPVLQDVKTRRVQKALIDFIMWLTISDNQDPLTREGLPHRQRQTPRLSRAARSS